MNNTERYLLKCRLAHLKQWRREISEEFEKFDAFYTIQFIREQFRMFDKKIAEVESLLNTQP